MSKVILETHLPLTLVKRGKVRDIFELPENKLLLVSTDRISAFDRVMKEGIPEKGRVLTLVSKFWLEFISRELKVQTHFLSDDLTGLGLDPKIVEENDLSGRIMIVKKALPIPLEWIIRGYLCGSLWKEYQDKNYWMSNVWKGIKLAERLPQPIIRFSAKESSGHDQPLQYNEARDLFARFVKEKGLLKKDASPYFLFEDLVLKALDLYNRASQYCETRGLIIADTKLEFGFSIAEGQAMLIDEVLTPDSSRFWPKREYQAGQNQKSCDKQILRDWLESQNWDKESEPPSLPADLIEVISATYQNVLQTLTAAS